MCNVDLWTELEGLESLPALECLVILLAQHPQKSRIPFARASQVYAHKLLCMRCSYFRAMFEGQMREAPVAEARIVQFAHQALLSRDSPISPIMEYTRK